MSAAAGPAEIVAGGLGALLGPGLALSVGLLLLAGVAFSARRTLVGHLITAAVLALVFGTATARRGLAEPGFTATLVALASLLVLSWMVVLRREEHHATWPVFVTGLVLATLAVQWRTDLYGPVLGSLRGSWQTPPDRLALLLYHAATGIGLGLVYLIGVGLGHRLPARVGPPLVWLASVGAGALFWTGLWSQLVQTLLLRWPHVGLG